MSIVSSHAKRAIAASWALCMALAGGIVEGADRSLSLTEAIELAQSRGPLIAGLAAEADALANRAEAESLPPGFVIESELENFAGTGSVSGTDALEATVRVSRVFELGNKAGLRRAVGAADLDRLTSEQAVRRSDLAAEVARRFIEVVSDQQSLEATRRATELTRTSRDVVRARVEAGAASPTALSRAEIALSRAEIAEGHAEHELQSSRVKLAALWGDANATFDKAAGELFELPQIESLDAYRAQLERNPALTRFAAEERLQNARVRLAVAQRKPDISLGAGVRRLEALDEQALVASFSVPLGTRRRAGLEEQAARADRARVDLERRAQQIELQATLFELYQEIVHARSEAERLHSSIRPQAAAMVATTSDGYRAGRFSQLELADAQAQMLEIERDSIRAAAQFHTLLIDIQRITAAPIRSFDVGRIP